MGIGGVLRWIFGIILAVAGILCLASILFPGGGPRHEWFSVLNLFYLVFAAVFLGLSYLITIHVQIRKAKRATARERQLIGDKYSRSSVLLDRVDKGHEQPWILELLVDRVLLHGTKEEHTIEIPLASAENTILLPGFAEERSRLEIRLADQVMSFRNPGARTKRIRSWLDMALAVMNPGVRRAILRKGIAYTCLGAVLIVAGPIASILSYRAAQSGSSGTYYIFYGLSLVGLVVLAKGIAGLRRHSRLKWLTSASAGGNAGTRPTAE